MHARIRIPALILAALVVGGVLVVLVARRPVREEGLVTIVILPPRAAGDLEAQQEAELYGDLLAQAIEKTAGLAVVDRKQIDRILAEHKLDEATVKPVLSYDAMVRLEFETAKGASRVRATVLDLSMGNVMGSKTFSGKDLPVQDMATWCAEAARRAAQFPKDRIKVRLLNVEIVENVARLVPLGEQLRRTFEDLLSRSPKMVLVQHLEAQSAKEESLLLLMGMSQLPGGRDFAPQANATIGFRLREAEAIGKTFEETVIELGCRVEKGKPGDWWTTKGKPGEWDRLVQEAWKKCASEVAAIDPKAADDFLNEMKVRRRQAEAELKRFEDWEDNNAPQGVVKEMANTASTAAKLDPSWERAAYLSARYNLWLLLGEGADVGGIRTNLEDVLNYVRRFRDNPEHRGQVLHEVSIYATAFAPFQRENPDAREKLNLVRRILDELLADPVVLGDGRYYEGPIVAVYEGMLVLETPEEEARAWRDEAFRKAAGQFQAAIRKGALHRLWVQNHYWPLLNRAIDCALDEDHPERAGALAVAAMEAARPHQDGESDLPPKFDDRVGRLNDPVLLERARKLVKKEVPDGGVGLVRIDWPSLDLGEEVRGIPAVACKQVRRAKRGDEEHEPRMAALGEIGNRMFLLFDMSGNWLDFQPRGMTQVVGNIQVAYVLLDDAGAPAGDLVEMPQPKVRGRFYPNSAAVLAGRIFIATEQSGIVSYDPGKEQWKIYGAEEGVPDWRVYEIHPLDERKLLCVGGEFGKKAIIYTLDVASGEVTLLQRTAKSWHEQFWSTFAVWHVGDKLSGLCRDGLIEDLLGDNPQVRPWPQTTPQGWPLHIRCAQSMAVVKGRRFVMSLDGLREIDDRGKVLRAWPNNFSHRFGLTQWFETTVVPGELPGLSPGPDVHGSPGSATLLGHDDAYLYLWNSDPPGLVCYDPGKDTWYGPVQVRGLLLPRGLGGRNGIWLSQQCPPVYMSADAVISAARDAGRLMTSQELATRRQKLFDAAPPMDRAKFAFARHRLEEAKELLRVILQKEPENVEALILMGLLHDDGCLNRRGEAIEWYQRLAVLTDNPDAAFTGFYLQYHARLRAKEWAEALKLGQEMTEHFNIKEFYLHDIREMNRQLAAKAGK